MVFNVLRSLGVVLLLTAGCVFAGDKAVNSVHDFTLKAIDGKDYPLSQHKGEVLLIVNVASECGYTGQYAGLQALYAKYKDKGLVVIGVPANEFGAQEPGTNEQIQAFCSNKYKVTFPMMAKTVVKGEGICPLYAYLITKGSNPKPVSWNFNKFLVGKDGKVIEHYESSTAPADANLAAKIEEALAAK